MVVNPEGRRWLPGLAAAALLCYALLYFAVLALRPFSDSTLLAFDDIGAVAATFTASGLLLLASRSAEGSIRFGWLCLGLALFAWGIGDSIWSAYELALDREVPFPSLGDAFYLSGYPLLFAGVLSFSHRDRTALSLRTALDAVAVTLAGSAVVWRIAVEPIFADSSSGVLDKVLSGLYPMGDMLVLFALALAIFRHREGQAGTVFSVFALGMFVVLISDVGFAYAENAGIYETGSLLDAGWVFGFLLMGYGGLLHFAWLPKYSTESDDLTDPAWKQGLPLVVMIAITSWIIIDGFDGRAAGLPLVGAILLMMCAVVVRHFLTLHENIELRVVLEQAYTAEQQRARTDSLTGKFSRRAILESLEALLRASPPRGFAIGMVDIDGMKRINDGFGHQCGDEALSAVAAALEPGAVVGRYGGDEFIVILENAGLADVGEYRNEVSAKLANWTAARRDGLDLTVSLGFAFAPSEGTTAADLIDLADRRMYDVKDIKSVVSRGASAA